MVLWKKESNHDGALYIDLLSTNEPNDSLFNRMFARLESDSAEKNYENSTKLRERGNGKFKAQCWQEAMELYNESLRFATKESENISLAYANRSACFLNLQKYDQCLADIKLAKKSNYPQRLMSKLVNRENKCLTRLKESINVKTNSKSTLSFAPDDVFPCMANVLEIRYNNQFSKHIVAKSDIDLGQIVLIEEAFMSEVIKCDQTYCCTCLKSETNFIPCPNCSGVMFCNEECMMTHKVHQMACGTSYQKKPAVTSIIETILIAVASFASVDDLMKFVENALASRDIDASTSGSSAQLNYGLFLKLSILSRETDLVLKAAFSAAYRILLEIPEINRRFNSKQKRRFLMHLTWQHYLITHTNAILYHENENNLIGIVTNVLSLFNHACSYNVSVVRCQNRLMAYAVRPVKKGEQLYIKYFGSELHGSSTAERQSFLRERFQFDCTCSRCVPRYKQEDSIKMQAEPDFKLFGQLNDVDFFDSKKRSFLISKFRKFLNKYGQLPWTDEIDIAVIGFEQCMAEEYTNF